MTVVKLGVGTMQRGRWTFFNGAWFLLVIFRRRKSLFVGTVIYFISRRRIWIYEKSRKYGFNICEICKQFDNKKINAIIFTKYINKYVRPNKDFLKICIFELMLWIFLNRQLGKKKLSHFVEIFTKYMNLFKICNWFAYFSNNSRNINKCFWKPRNVKIFNKYFGIFVIYASKGKHPKFAHRSESNDQFENEYISALYSW